MPTLSAAQPVDFPRLVRPFGYPAGTARGSDIFGYPQATASGSWGGKET